MCPMVPANSSPLQALSPRGALSALFRAASPAEQRLAFLDVFRVCAICWVISNHLGSEGRLDVLRALPSGDRFKHIVHSHPILGPIFGNSALGVEVFLVLSGLLAARSWHRRWSPQQPFWHNSFTFLFRRWLRLAPTTIAFVLFTTSAAGRKAFPLFHHSMASNCTNVQLLSHALMFSNLNRSTNCLVYLWYLGLDWQCHLITPLLLHLLFRRPKTGLALMISLITASMILRGIKCRAYGVCNKSDVDIPFIAVPARADYAALYELYTRLPTKCGPFLIGLLLGVFTLRAEKKFEDGTMPNWMAMASVEGGPRRLFWAGALLAVGTVYGILPEYWHPNQGVTLYNTLYTATFRTLFAAGIGAMLLGCYCTSNSSSSRPRPSLLWAVLARLTFGTFLVHMPVIFLFTRLAAFQQFDSPYALLIGLLPAIPMSFAAALIFHCLIEWPVAQTVKMMTT